MDKKTVRVVALSFFLSCAVAVAWVAESHLKQHQAQRSAALRSMRHDVDWFNHTGFHGKAYNRRTAAVRAKQLSGDRLDNADVSAVLDGLDSGADVMPKFEGLWALHQSALAGRFPMGVRDSTASVCIRELGNKELLVRQNCARLLGDLRYKRAVPRLLPLLNDPNKQVRRVVRDSLRELGYANQ